MTEYIDKRAVYEVACRGCTRHGDEPMSCYDSEPCERLTNAFACAPAADVAPVRHGRWKFNAAHVLWEERYICSECGKNAPSIDGYSREFTNYCQNCGARMDLGGADDA